MQNFRLVNLEKITNQPYKNQPPYEIIQLIIEMSDITITSRIIQTTLSIISNSIKALPSIKNRGNTTVNFHTHKYEVKY